MNEDETGLWLKRLVDAPYFDIWLAASYMYRYPSTGVQQYICSRIKYHEPVTYLLPQLVHIFLYYNDTVVSRPIYNLFKFWAYRSPRFSCALYFHLKSVLERDDGGRSVQCYLLICDLFEMDRRSMCRNTRILSLQHKYRRRIGRTVGLPVLRQGYPLFKGLFLFFVEAVSWPLNGEFFKKVWEYGKVFLKSRGTCSINIKRRFRWGAGLTGTELRSNIGFLESLVGISSRLKRLPGHLRQRGLEMEIRLLNYSLPARANIPFCLNRSILTARIEESFPLDSAENSPFLIVFETSNRIEEDTRHHTTRDNRSALFLTQQLNAISGLSSLSEIEVIKDNMIDSMEKILMVNMCSEGASTTGDSDCKPASVLETPWSRKEMKKYLDDAGIGRKISKQGDHEMFLLDDRSYSAGQLTQEEDGDWGNDILGADGDGNKAVDAKQSQKEYGESGGYRLHDSWMLKKAEIRRSSVFRDVPGWSVESIIVKTGTSVRQELAAYQVLTEMRNIWREEDKAIWVYGYQIYMVSETSGVVETVKDAMSVHKIKKKMMSENKSYFLKNYFVESFGMNTARYKKSLRNFLYSLVGYSLATYILQIKDRHNGNIMVDRQGHIIHVDFGFIMGLHPGFYCVEVAPFKFSKEYFDLLEDLIDEFKVLFLEGYMALRKHNERLCRIVEMISEDSAMECFSRKELGNFRDRLKLDLSDKEVEEHVLYLINKSFNSMGTGLYDSYQYFSYGYL